MNNYDYPMGADTRDAPWNQEDPKELKVNVCVSTTLSRSTKLIVTDYDCEYWEDSEMEDDGSISHTGGIDYNFSNCDFKKAYKEQEYTIPELLSKLKEYVEKDLKNCSNNKLKKYQLQDVLHSCEGWTEDEFEIIQE